MTAQTNGVDFIINSKRQYPDWIKNHRVFKEMNTIDKIFPKIGLPNFKEECTIMNSAEALACATHLGNRMISNFRAARVSCFKELTIVLKSDAKDRNETCAKLQRLADISSNLDWYLSNNIYASLSEGKVVLKLHDDMFNGDKVPLFRKGEMLPRIYGKMVESLSEVKISMTKLDNLDEFKNFCKINIPSKKYNIIFSSYGEEGVWDISTASMRGITSCQAWNAPQSRGLVGSISSKFVGIIYLASDQEIPGYGSKMLNRSMVRFAIEKSTKKPVLLIDHMYPNQNNDVVNSFKEILSKKSGMKVLYTYDSAVRFNSTNYYIPDEPLRKFLNQGEHSYMDSPVEVSKHVSAIKELPKNYLSLIEKFKAKVQDDLDNHINLKREVFIDANKRLEVLKDEYAKAKEAWEKENLSKPEDERTKFEFASPKIDEEFAQFGKGGVINLLNHCDKRYGKGKAASAFAKIILDSVPLDATANISTKEDVYRRYLRALINNSSKVKETALEKSKQASWNKSFPKSSEKFFNGIFSQMKPYFLNACKEIIKNQN